MSEYEKILKQIKHKEGKKKKFEKHNTPKERGYGKDQKECRRCGRTGIISKYKLNYCRQCFREIAEKLGFQHLR
ncbi:MAG: 30S ribosomal protein S14 [Candidatus Nanohaloarchaea archaeon]